MMLKLVQYGYTFPSIITTDCIQEENCSIIQKNPSLNLPLKLIPWMLPDRAYGIHICIAHTTSLLYDHSYRNIYDYHFILFKCYLNFMLF